MAARSVRHQRDHAEARQYSAAVRRMKIVLPIGALILIGMIFLTGEDRNAVVDAETAADVAILGAGLKLDNPRFAGVTDSGDPFVVTADWALPDGAMPDRIDLEKPKGEVRLSNDLTVNVVANSGQMRRKDDELHLSGEVELVSSDGYTARTENVQLDLARKSATVPGAVSAEGPRGRIEADKMRMDTIDADRRDVVLFFEGNVRLRILPSQN
ncbi:MAG: LPS export ABC transporter periplasmic protein LptC [Pseudomonadota bacterium]